MPATTSLLSVHTVECFNVFYRSLSELRVLHHLTYFEVEFSPLVALSIRLHIGRGLRTVEDLNVLVTRDLGVTLWRLLDTRHVLANVVDGNPAQLDVGQRQDIELIGRVGPRLGLEDVLDEESLSALEVTALRVVVGRHGWIGREVRGCSRQERISRAPGHFTGYMQCKVSSILCINM